MKLNKKQKEYLKSRTRPGQRKTVTVKVTDYKNYGLKEVQELDTGYCPCSICGHTIMLYCYEQDCQCCSSACT